MAKGKYKVRRVRKEAPKENTGKAVMGRGKLLLWLLVGTVVIAGVYIACMQLRIEAVFHAYWIAAAVLTCAAAFLKYRNEARVAVCKAKNGGTLSDADHAECAKHDKTLKILLLVLIPLLLTVFGDAVYLVLLKDLHLSDAVKNLFAAKS